MSNPQKFIEARLKVAEGIMMEIVGDMAADEGKLDPAGSDLDASYFLARQFTKRPKGHLGMILGKRRLESAERILSKFVNGMEEVACHGPLGSPLAADYGLACRFLGK